jgi:cytochrome b6-f complex iron-sulfur subunit
MIVAGERPNGRGSPMAERPSVKDILAAARKGGPAVPSGEAPPAASAPEPETHAAAPEASAGAAPSVPPPAPSLGRPLTLKEKLAAARAGGAPAATPAPPAAAAPAPVAAAGDAEKAVPPPAPSLGRPMTLKEKLAAARGAAAPAAGATPAAGAAPVAKAAAAPKAAVARDLPPLAEMTDPKDLAEALRQAGAQKDKDVAGAAAKAAPPRPAAKPKAEAKTVPGKPSKAAALTEGTTPATGTTRRQALKFPWIVAGWASFTIGLGAFTAMLGRFMFPNVLAEPPSTVKVGVPSDFAKEDVSERWKAEWGFWIVRTERVNGQDIIFALQSVCTHLGCPPNWLAGEQKFKCPCHGSGFYISGINFEGPAPRPLERFRVAIADDGQILVDKSHKFQEELAQWTDPDSFLPAV